MNESGFLIAGLGNPGTKYDGTRHNVGFHIVDEIARRLNTELSLEKWEAHYSRIKRWGSGICFIKPQTYMNLSGKAVARFASYYKTPPGRILVIQDDIDMACGRLKLVSGGGAGGHNGIRSLIQWLGTADFHRLKFGIGRPGQAGISAQIPVDAFVLSPFEDKEKEIIKDRLDFIERGLKVFIEGDIVAAKNLLNALR